VKLVHLVGFIIKKVLVSRVLFYRVVFHWRCHVCHSHFIVHAC